MAGKKLYFSDYLRIVKENTPKPIYLLYGTELFQRDQILKILLKRFSNEASKEFDTITFFGDENDAESILEQLEMMPFMSDFKLIILKDLDKMTPTDKKKIAEYCSSPMDTSIFIIIADKVDARTSIVKTIQKNGLAIECKAPYNERDLQRWLQTRCRELNLRMTPEAIVMFSQIIELDYQIAANELEKVILYNDKKAMITPDIIRLCVGTSKTHNIFELQRAVGNRDLKKAMEYLQNMIENQESLIFVIVMLNRFFQILWKINAHRKMHLTDFEISQTHLKEVFHSFRKEYIQFSRKYELKDFPKVFNTLLEADTKCKTTNIKESIIGDMMLIKILRK